MYIFSTDDPPMEPVSLNIMTHENQSISEIIRKLHPAMEKNIVMEELVPYLNKHGLLTQIDKEILGPTSTTPPTLKTRQFLFNLHSKGPDGEKNFIKALFESAKVPGHQYLIKLLKDNGVTIEKVP